MQGSGFRPSRVYGFGVEALKGLGVEDLGLSLSSGFRVMGRRLEFRLGFALRGVELGEGQGMEGRTRSPCPVCSLCGFWILKHETCHVLWES